MVPDNENRPLNRHRMQNPSFVGNHMKPYLPAETEVEVRGAATCVPHSRGYEPGRWVTE